jgi:hypothetical protein
MKMLIIFKVAPPCESKVEFPPRFPPTIGHIHNRLLGMMSSVARLVTDDMIWQHLRMRMKHKGPLLLNESNMLHTLQTGLGHFQLTFNNNIPVMSRMIVWILYNVLTF